MIVVLALVLAITLVLVFCAWRFSVHNRPSLKERADGNIRPFMGLEIYVDGKHAASLGSARGWDAAARWIEKHTAYRTPLRRLAELGETYQPQQAALLLSHLLEHQTCFRHRTHLARPLPFLDRRSCPDYRRGD